MKSIAEINAIRDKMKAQIENRDNTDESAETRIVVGMATCGIAAGALPVFNEFVEEVHSKGLAKVKVTRSGCLGMCKLEPIVEIYAPGQDKVTYVKVTADKAKEIIKKHIVGGEICSEYLANED